MANEKTPPSDDQMKEAKDAAQKAMNDAKKAEQVAKEAMKALGIDPDQKTPLQRLSENLPIIITSVMMVSVPLLGAAIAVLFLWGFIDSDSIIRDLGDASVARGVITFVFAIGTMGVALMLTIAVLANNQQAGGEKREFKGAKDVLTVLIGVFGTILGFYFGTDRGSTDKTPLTSSPVRVEFTADQKSAEIFAFINGGKSPYTYSISFAKGAIPPIADRSSTDGFVKESVSVEGLEGKKIGFTVRVRDSSGSALEFGGELKPEAAAEGAK